jgi:hypothetical protein
VELGNARTSTACQPAARARRDHRARPLALPLRICDNGCSGTARRQPRRSTEVRSQR